MKRKNNVLILIIIILSIVIGALNYNRLSVYQNNSRQNGIVKSARDQKENPDSLDIQINRVPQKAKNFNEPNILANSYILFDGDSFYPLAGEKIDDSVPIASTTKIMTAIVILENYKLDDLVTVSNNAVAQIGSESFLRVGEKISVQELLYCLLINSDNEAAMALAEHKTGDYKDFVKLMNDKTQYLGLKNTGFKDPAGLDDSGYSTPRDLAIMTAYALKNEIFSSIIKTPEVNIVADNGITYQLTNSNRLIRNEEPLYYFGATGVKTGYTPDAGHCLVSSAEKDGHTIIGVILKTFKETNDASALESNKLLDWGFNNYEWK